MTERLNWGILGSGAVARLFAAELPASRTGRLFAVASRTAESAQAFAVQTGAEVSFASYAELLADDRVDAVYVATVASTHHELALQAVRAGRHVLVEHPLAVSQPLAAEVVAAARASGVFLAEANLYRFSPQTWLLRDLVAEGVVGRILAIEASCGYLAEPWPGARESDPARGGGAILGVGGYPVSMARLLAGAASGQAFAEPDSATVVGTVGETGVDEWAAATLTFAAGITARVAAGVRAGDDNAVKVYGSRGYLFVPLPWVLPAGEPGKVVVTEVGVGRRTESAAAAPVYAREADALGLRGAAVECAEMSWADSLGTARVLDDWRAALR